MAQFSMEIMRLTGSVPRGNQHLMSADGRYRAVGDMAEEEKLAA